MYNFQIKKIRGKKKMLNMQLNNSGTDMLIKFIVLIVYFAFMIGVGMYFYKKNTSHSDYILGGGS